MSDDILGVAARNKNIKHLKIKALSYSCSSSSFKDLKPHLCKLKHLKSFVLSNIDSDKIEEGKAIFSDFKFVELRKAKKEKEIIVAPPQSAPPLIHVERKYGFGQMVKQRKIKKGIM